MMSPGPSYINDTTAGLTYVKAHFQQYPIGLPIFCSLLCPLGCSYSKLNTLSKWIDSLTDNSELVNGEFNKSIDSNQ